MFQSSVHWTGANAALSQYCKSVDRDTDEQGVEPGMWGQVLLVVVGSASIALSGCATITKGTTQSVSIDTPGAPGASCTLTSSAIGSKTIVTPTSLVLDKGQENIAVTCKKECFQDAVGIIPSHTESMAAGNVIVGGVVGLGVDAISGALNKYNDINQFAMVPNPSCRPGGAPVAAPRPAPRA